MSAEDNLGQQFVTVYRGLPTHPKNVRTNFAGIHWSESMDAAASFAKPYYITHDTNGTVIEAQVEKKHIVEPYSKEWEEYGGGDSHSGYGIFAPSHEEQETTIRRGAPIHVTKLHHFLEGKKAGELQPEWERDTSA